MARSQVTVRVRRDPDVVFACIQSHIRSNDPAWEPETLGVEALDDGPVRVGWRARMTRKDFGSTHATVYEVTRIDPPRELAIRHLDGPLDFALDFRVAAAGPEAADVTVTVTVDVAPRGAMRLMWPVFALTGGSRNRRISSQMVAAIEAATEPGAAAAASDPSLGPARA